MKAVILAGGFGTRLRPLTINFPKPMIPVANLPMMEHGIRLCEKHGFRDLLAMLHYSPEVIKRHFESGQNWDVKISYLKPEADFGTAGCIRFASQGEQHHWLKDEPFLVISGDVLTDIDLKKAWNFHKEKNAAATLVLSRSTNPLSYGVVIVDDNGRVIRFLEKPTWGEVFSDTINTGIYILSPDVVGQIPEGQEFDFSKNLFPKMMQLGMPIYGYVANGYWKDVGDLTEYRTAHIDILEGVINVAQPGQPLKDNPDVIVGDNCQIEPGVKFEGRSIIGKNCHIASGAIITQSVIGPNTNIGSGASIRKSVIWERTTIGPEVQLREAIVGRSVKIGARARIEVGGVVGNRCDIGADALLRPSVKMWPEKTLETGAVLATSLVWGERWNRGLFGAVGITGLTNIEITPEFAAKLGAAYGAYLGQGSYVITSRDANKASRLIKRAIISGLLSSGVRVGDLRMLPVPVVRYEMGKEGEMGGVHVRVSPFNPRQLDIRIFDRDGNDLSVRKEKAVEQLFIREDFKRAEAQDVGDLSVPPRAQEYYRTGFIKNINVDLLRNRKFKIVVDYSHSPASLIFPELLGEMGIESVAINAHTSSSQTTRTPNEFQNSLNELAHIVKTLKADGGFLMDNGAEKLFMVDGNGNIFSSEEALVLVGLLCLKGDGRDVIAYPVRGSSLLERLATLKGATVLRTSMDHRLLLESARRSNVGFVGESEGGFIFPGFQPAFDGMYAAVKILEMLAERKTTLAQFWAGIEERPGVIHRSVPCGWAQKGQVMRLAQKVQGDVKIELIDGVKIHFMNGWVLILPDANLAYCHVWAEAKTPEETKKILDEYCKKVLEWQKPDDTKGQIKDRMEKV